MHTVFTLNINTLRHKNVSVVSLITDKRLNSPLSFRHHSSIGKTFFVCLFFFFFAFYFKWNLFFFFFFLFFCFFVFFFFCFRVLLSNIYPKIKFTAKTWSDLLWISIKTEYILLFFVEFELLMFHNNIVKNSENWTSRTCGKSASKLPTLQISALFPFFSYYGKKWKYYITKKKKKKEAMTRIKLFVHM